MNLIINAILVSVSLGIILGAILAIASKVFEVKEDERVTTIINMLPGYNCGACGFPGCSGLANALVNQETNIVSCKPCKKDRMAEIVEYINNSEGPNGERLNCKAG